jgi:hypothetical protein
MLPPSVTRHVLEPERFDMPISAERSSPRSAIRYMFFVFDGFTPRVLTTSTRAKDLISIGVGDLCPANEPEVLREGDLLTEVCPSTFWSWVRNLSGCEVRVQQTARS